MLIVGFAEVEHLRAERVEVVLNLANTPAGRAPARDQ